MRKLKTEIRRFVWRIRRFWNGITNEEKRGMKLASMIGIAMIIVAGTGMKLMTSKAITASVKVNAGALPIFFTVDMIKFDDEKAIAGVIDSFEPAIYSKKNVDGPIPAMKRIDQLEKLITTAGEKHGFDPKILEGIIYLESGGRQFALSGSSCAGIAQFAPKTAREYGLKVSHNWRGLYHEYEKTGRVEALVKYDQRFNRPLAIEAQARFLADMQKLYGSSDYAIAAYHMGIGNMKRVVKKYRSGWDAPATLTWADIVMDAAPYRHPGAHQLLYHELEDSSWSYYFRVLAAMKARELWKKDRVGFIKKVDELNNPLRRSQLVRETVWYPKSKMPQWSTETIRMLTTKENSLTEIREGEFMSVTIKNVSNPVLTSNTLGALYTIASIMRQETGRGIVVTSATRDYDLQKNLVNQGLSPAIYSSHLWGSGIDIALYEDEKLNDALSWILNEMKWRGDIVWYQEGNHFHVTVAPGNNLMEVAESAQTYYTLKVAEDKKVRVAKR